MWEQYEIGPERAAELLEDTRQTDIRLKDVRALLKKVKEGEWDPEVHKKHPIHIRDGMLINGHHRLLTVLMFQKPLMFYVREERKD